MMRAEVIRAVKKARRVFVATGLSEGRVEYFQVTNVEALFRLGNLTNSSGDIRCEVQESVGSLILGGR